MRVLLVRRLRRPRVVAPPCRGISRHEVLAEDGHRLRVYHNEAPDARHSVVLLHGRTWSSLPVWDLHVQDEGAGVARSLSLMSVLATLGINAYAVDLRGFGETTRDASGFCSPEQCVADLATTMNWAREHARREYRSEAKPTLLGWSQGALVAMLYSQAHHETIDTLVLYAAIYEPRDAYPRRPLYCESRVAGTLPNTTEAALEDFTLPGSISDAAAEAFAKSALRSDAIKVEWTDLHQFNACSPPQIQVPTLLIHGDQDPYLDLASQQQLFRNLGTRDKMWIVLPNADHAAHLLLNSQPAFVRALAAFLSRADPIDKGLLVA